MKIAPLALLAAAVSSPALAAGQLPRTVTPVLYDIKVEPDAAKLSFTGTETVTVDVVSATDTITLNAADLEISSATFDGKAATFTLAKDRQELTIKLAKPATVGRHTLTLAWKGTIDQSASGLFAIDYNGVDGKPARMLVTQFEAADARRFAPMWDEPAFKAKFRLSTVAPAGQTAFSNMPAASVTKRADGSQIVQFGETPVMSSYLLFLGQGDVERHTVQAGKTEIGVITRRGTGDQTEYALSAAARLLPYYNDYFGVDYPLPKLDMIGGPGSSQFFGAMENWGAIFYFENELLFDKTLASESQKQRIYIVIAHEMAHQWFGDLVTMNWWDDLWLNEGFASWMENKSTQALMPQWNTVTQAVAIDREDAMTQDGVATTHPIIRPIETVAQMSDAFDRITYEKGQAVIGMIESTVGADRFRAGVRSYMAKHKYGNTVTDDLWAEVGAAAPDVPVADIMHDFTLQGGVPMITVNGVTCSGGTTSVALTQGRWGMDEASKAPLTWRVPVRLGVLGGETTTGIVRGAAGATLTAPGCGTAIVNRGKGGYFRVKYDAASHAAIVRDFAKLDLTDQLGTLGDDFALTMSGDQDLSVYLATLGAVKTDAPALEWRQVAGQLGQLAGFYQDSALEKPLAARIRALLGPVLKRIGATPVAGEDPLVAQLRETLISRLGFAGDPDVAAQARTYVTALKSDPTAIPPGIRRAVLNVYARNATPAEWDVLLALTRAEKNPVTKNTYVSLLGGSSDAALAQKALALVATEEFTAPQRATLLVAISGSHPDMAFDFAVANLAMVDSLNEESSRARYVAGLGQTSTDPAMPGKIQAYAKAHLDEKARGTADRVVNYITVRKATAERLRPAVTNWVGSGKGK